jgi:deoxyribose-phosphate aldolase
LRVLFPFFISRRLPVKPAELFEEKHRLAALIDHTLLKPEAIQTDIERVCEEALIYGFAAVCINPFWVPVAAQRLRASPVRVCTVVGFPLGSNQAETKVQEANMARCAGAEEIDMVINIGALLSGDYGTVEREVASVAEAAHEGGGLLKAILETCLLTDDQKTTASRIAVEAGADFVKTSTGFSAAGATVADIRLMRDAVGTLAGVKASGGIKTLAAVRSMLAAGASRIGASAGVNILKELEGAPEASSASSY